MKKISFYLLGTILALGVLFASCERDELTPVNQINSKIEKALPSVDIELCFDVDQVEPYAVCPDVIDPVCACNMVTYQNECLARNAGWTQVTSGPCPIREACRSDLLASALDNIDYQCAAIYQPVCGCDGRTYSNSCVAVGNGVLAFTPGPCPNVGEIIDAIELRELPEVSLCYDATQVDPTANCPRVVDPVCACNMITFQNECQARNAGWTSITPGPCPIKEACRSDLLASVLDNIDYQCAAVYQPVCGCDGNTYSNYCTAIGNGVLAWTPGRCGEIPADDVVRTATDNISIGM